MTCSDFLSSITETEAIHLQLNTELVTDRIRLIPNKSSEVENSFFIESRETSELLGAISFHRSSRMTEVIIYIKEGNENNGYAYEAMTTLLAFFFTKTSEGSSTRIHAFVHFHNTASATLMNKIGFEHTGYSGGKFDRFSISRDDFLSQASITPFSSSRMLNLPTPRDIAGVLPGYLSRWGNSFSRASSDPYKSDPYIDLGSAKFNVEEILAGFQGRIEYVENSDTEQIYRKMPDEDWVEISRQEFEQDRRLRRIATPLL